MSKCGKGCMPECEYFTTGGCISPFNCPYKIETGYINTAMSIPAYMEQYNGMSDDDIERCLERLATCKTTDVMNFDYAGTLAYIKRLKSENAELKSSLTHANEECLKWHERAQNLLKDSGGSISGYEKKISDLQAENAALRERLKEAEHRAEVMERALLWLCDTAMRNVLVMAFPSTKTQVRNKQELYDYCIAQAEKELAEEQC